MLLIEHIETAGPDARARRLLFSDHTDRTTAAAVVKALGLAVGLSVDSRDLEASLREEEAHQAKERALRILGYRERSRAEVLKRLTDDGYPRDIAAPLVERLADLALVDDERFALLYSRTRAAAGLGRSRIMRELAGKGVDARVASAAVDEALGDSDEVERAREALRGRTWSNRSERDKLLRRLISKGFDMSTALRATDHEGE